MQNIQVKELKQQEKKENKQLRAQRHDKLRLEVKTLVSILRNCYFFVLASFLNMICPIVICIVLAYIPDYGLQCILGIGRATYFTICFVQMALTFTISVTSLYKKFFLPYKMLDAKTRDSYVVSNSIAFTFIIALVMILIYNLSSYAYLYYSTYIPNSYTAYYEALNYIFTTDPYIFFICLMDILFLYILSVKKNTAIYFILLFYGLSYVFIYLLADCGHLLGIGAGLGLLFACLVSIGFMALFIFIEAPISIVWRLRSFVWRMQHIKGIAYECVTGLCINTFRGLGVLILAFTVFRKAGQDVIPMAYNVAIIFLLNYMYIIAFVGIGFSDTIKYYYVYYPVYDKTQRTSPFWAMIVINLLVACLVTYIMSVATTPLATLYTLNNTYLPPQELPPLPATMPSIPGNHFPPTLFPNMPTDYFNKKLSEAQKIKNYIDSLMQNPQNNPEFFVWVNWFKGCSPILQGWIMEHTTLFYHWLQTYEYYSSCPPEVVNAFINLRTPYQISHPDNFELLVPQLAFNAKSMIYLGAFGTMYSSYYIYSASASSLNKHKMPVVITIVGAFLLITFVIIFGGCFTMLLPNWKANPFQNLDAFTFPLMLIGFILMFIGFNEFVITILHVKRTVKKKVRKNALTSVKLVDDAVIL